MDISNIKTYHSNQLRLPRVFFSKVPHTRHSDGFTKTFPTTIKKMSLRRNTTDHQEKYSVRIDDNYNPLKTHRTCSVEKLGLFCDVLNVLSSPKKVPFDLIQNIGLNTGCVSFINTLQTKGNEERRERGEGKKEVRKKGNKW